MGKTRRNPLINWYISWVSLITIVTATTTLSSTPIDNQFKGYASPPPPPWPPPTIRSEDPSRNGTIIVAFTNFTSSTPTTRGSEPNVDWLPPQYCPKPTTSPVSDCHIVQVDPEDPVQLRPSCCTPHSNLLGAAYQGQRRRHYRASSTPRCRWIIHQHASNCFILWHKSPCYKNILTWCWRSVPSCF